MNFLTRSGTLFLFLAPVLLGCTPALPHRTMLVDVGSGNCAAVDSFKLAHCATISPESSPSSYELHFVEYDDQGWAYTMPTSASQERTAAGVVSQTDHLMTRLGTLLGKENRYVNVILYVHGWKHDAGSDDSDVRRFRTILSSAVKLESRKANPRKVVGIYVGWRGKSWELPSFLLNGSFWSRKAAAERVSQGAVQELFARLRTVQRYYNNIDSPDCSPARSGVLTTGGCRFRILMIGHSFGADVLFSAIKGPLIATLNAEKDLTGALYSVDLDKPNAKKQVANARPADLIVLINPAFEAVRYQPLHQAAINYRSATVQPPLLVTITSSADHATKDAFPVGRFINTIFEHPTTSDEQSEAMAHTHGHIELYQTHKLVSLEAEPCDQWIPPGPLSTTDVEVMRQNKEIEQRNSAHFFNKYVQKDTGLLRAGWERSFCGGVKLMQLAPTDPGQNRDPNSLVWNIRTDKSIISSHTDIVEAKFLEFVRQLYDDTDLQWKSD